MSHRNAFTGMSDLSQLLTPATNCAKCLVDLATENEYQVGEVVMCEPCYADHFTETYKAPVDWPKGW